MSRFVDPLVVGTGEGDRGRGGPLRAVGGHGRHLRRQGRQQRLPRQALHGRRPAARAHLRPPQRPLHPPDDRSRRAPSPSDPTMREYVHWIVMNIPGGTDATKGDLVLPYMGPQPTVGIHRYVLVLFEQKSRIVDGYASPPADRAYFNTRAFAANHELGLPVAVVYFNSQREPAGNRRRR